MSATLSSAAIAQFDAEVKHAYQKAGMLRGTVRVRTGIVGSTHRFPKLGKGAATRRTTHADVTLMNVSHTNATATMEDWCAAEYTDIFDQAAVNFDERRELATTIAGAIGRREDQLILDAIDAATVANTVSQHIGGTNTGLNTAKIRRAKRLLDAGGVPMGKGERTLAISAIGLEQLLGETVATSSDYAPVKALFDGEVDYWVGFQFKTMESRDEGGIPLSSTIRTNYAYHRGALGLAVGIDFRTEVNYIPQKTSWLSNGLFKAGAVAVDVAGLVEISTYEA